MQFRKRTQSGLDTVEMEGLSDLEFQTTFINFFDIGWQEKVGSILYHYT